MLEYIIQGRVMMIPLMICSVLAIGVVFDRGWAFWKHSRLDTRSLRARLMELLQQGNVQEAGLLCANTPGPVSAVLLAGVKSFGKHKPLSRRPESLTAIMKEAMRDYTAHAMSAVEKRFPVLQTVGNAAPLLGMTGTVIGMITAFAGMAESGVSNEAVSAGISEALITTAAGLIIALIAVVPLNYFTAVADKIELEIEESSAELLEFVATRIETEAA